MNTFAILLLCIQASLLQNVFSQCNYGTETITNAGLGLRSIAPSALTSRHSCWGSSVAGFKGTGLFGNTGDLGYGSSSAGVYSGVGGGNVAVIGELPVVGSTTVIGQVPILGAVNFGGNVAAAGSVSINGRSACECGC